MEHPGAAYWKFYYQLALCALVKTVLGLLDNIQLKSMLCSRLWLQCANFVSVWLLPSHCQIEGSKIAIILVNSGNWKQKSNLQSLKFGLPEIFKNCKE